MDELNALMATIEQTHEARQRQMPRKLVWAAAVDAVFGLPSSAAAMKHEGTTLVIGPSWPKQWAAASMLSWRSGVPLRDILSADIAQHQWAALAEAAGAITDSNITIVHALAATDGRVVVDVSTFSAPEWPGLRAAIQLTSQDLVLASSRETREAFLSLGEL